MRMTASQAERQRFPARAQQSEVHFRIQGQARNGKVAGFTET